MNNVKRIHTEETIMTNNNFKEGVTQTQCNDKILKTYAVHHSDLRIQPKPGGNNTKITHLHKCILSEYRPLVTPRDEKLLMSIIC